MKCITQIYTSTYMVAPLHISHLNAFHHINICSNILQFLRFVIMQELNVAKYRY